MESNGESRCKGLLITSCVVWTLVVIVGVFLAIELFGK